MGSASTKFRKHLQGGDEVQALELYRSNAELRKALDPNCSYGDSHSHETPLHLASQHAMQMLLGIFLFSKVGNPNKTNGRKETCLHCVCKDDSNWQSVHTQKRRAECLNYLLKWRGSRLSDGQMEKIDLAAQDEKLNTALHYAAASGLSQCVETLIQQGAPLFLENEDSLTPCDTAERNGHSDIALYLESKMVFSNDEELREEVDDVSMPPMEEYSGLRPQDLQEAKDMLLVETADMLSVPLFTAEALLRNHEWSRETLLEAWMTDPVLCCEKCGVTPPTSLFSDKPQVQENLASPLPSPLQAQPKSLDAECDICADTFQISDEPVHTTCGHRFCKTCWERYLNVKIQEGDAHHITCPAYDCSLLVPVDVIEGIVSRDMARRYLQFDIKAFVDSNPDMKWCPFPGCGRAVKLPELDTGQSSRAGQRYKIPSDTSRGVDCGGGHYFCWECLEESHEPCSCQNWTNWFAKISDIKPETLHDTEAETEVAANCLWLVTNSKPCPSCKSPIQKNEGCNHMKCSKCKYDFCWVCLEPWKRHNSSTGGYFMCNRYEVVKKVEEQSAEKMTNAESRNEKMQELNRFVHYYTRFKNHENSFKLEEPLLKTAKDKMMTLAEAVTDNATAQVETKFVEEAVMQLLKARRVLKCCYVYGFYLDGPGYKKIVFEFMQTELEECTEILSQMVNRLYLRTPRRKIIEQAHIVQRKRQEFIMAISKGLVPAETPPSVRKKKKKKKKAGDAVDEDLHRAIVASIQEVDPSNPWIKDASGKHTNMVALMDWPTDDSDDSDTNADKTSLGKCQRAECSKLRSRNPRTKEAHDYCSRWCMVADTQEKTTEQDGQEGVSDVVLDEHMELLRALEMSRLQFLRESGLLHTPSSQQSEDQQEAQNHSAKDRSLSSVCGDSDVKVRPVVSAIEDFDMELQRFQALSAGFPRGDRNDICCQAEKKVNLRGKSCQTSRFKENKSTVVTRVPNRSVEDLYCLESWDKGQSQGHRSTSVSGLVDRSRLSAATTSAPSPSICASENTSSDSSLAFLDLLSPNSSAFGSVREKDAARTHFSDSEGDPELWDRRQSSNYAGFAQSQGEWSRERAGRDSPTKWSDDSDSILPLIKGCKIGHGHINLENNPPRSKNTSTSRVCSSSDEKRSSSAAAFSDLLPSGTPAVSSTNESANHGISYQGVVSQSRETGNLSGTMFGAIKDLSVANIHSNETDKIKEFSSKDLASLLSNLNFGLEADVDLEDQPSGFDDHKNNLSSPAETFGDSNQKVGLNFPGNSGKSCNKHRPKMGKGRKQCGERLGAGRDIGSGDYDLECGGELSEAKACSSRQSESSLFGSIRSFSPSVTDGEAMGKGKGEDGRTAKELSLLKMAESLVQMTADIHLRMKEVEKEIQDMDCRSKLSSQRGSIVTKQEGSKCGESCPQEVESPDPDSSDRTSLGIAMPYFVKDVGSTLSEENDNSNDVLAVEDCDEWYDVPDTMPCIGDVPRFSQAPTPNEMESSLYRETTDNTILKSAEINGTDRARESLQSSNIPAADLSSLSADVGSSLRPDKNITSAVIHALPIIHDSLCLAVDPQEQTGINFPPSLRTDVIAPSDLVLHDIEDIDEKDLAATQNLASDSAADTGHCVSSGVKDSMLGGKITLPDLQFVSNDFDSDLAITEGCAGDADSSERRAAQSVCDTSARSDRKERERESKRGKGKGKSSGKERGGSKKERRAVAAAEGGEFLDSVYV